MSVAPCPLCWLMNNRWWQYSRNQSQSYDRLMFHAAIPSLQEYPRLVCAVFSNDGTPSASCVTFMCSCPSSLRYFSTLAPVFSSLHIFITINQLTHVNLCGRAAIMSWIESRFLSRVGRTNHFCCCLQRRAADLSRVFFNCLFHWSGTPKCSHTTRVTFFSPINGSTGHLLADQRRAIWTDRWSTMILCTTSVLQVFYSAVLMFRYWTLPVAVKGWTPPPLMVELPQRSLQILCLKTQNKTVSLLKQEIRCSSSWKWKVEFVSSRPHACYILYRQECSQVQLFLLCYLLAFTI